MGKNSKIKAQRRVEAKIEAVSEAIEKKTAVKTRSQKKEEDRKFMNDIQKLREDLERNFKQKAFDESKYISAEDFLLLDAEPSETRLYIDLVDIIPSNGITGCASPEQAREIMIKLFSILMHNEVSFDLHVYSIKKLMNKWASMTRHTYLQRTFLALRLNIRKDIAKCCHPDSLRCLYPEQVNISELGLKTKLSGKMTKFYFTNTVLLTYIVQHTIDMNNNLDKNDRISRDKLELNSHILNEIYENMNGNFFLELAFAYLGFGTGYFGNTLSVSAETETLVSGFKQYPLVLFKLTGLLNFLSDKIQPNDEKLQKDYNQTYMYLHNKNSSVYQNSDSPLKSSFLSEVRYHNIARNYYTTYPNGEAMRAEVPWFEASLGRFVKFRKFGPDGKSSVLETSLDVYDFMYSTLSQRFDWLYNHVCLWGHLFHKGNKHAIEPRLFGREIKHHQFLMQSNPFYREKYFQEWFQVLEQEGSWLHMFEDPARYVLQF
jgi:hypothetical protein